MSDHPNIALHQKAHEAAFVGDMETLTELTADDVVWHSLGKSQISGDFQGRETVFEDFFGKMAELSAGTANFTKRSTYFANGELSVSLFRWGATRGDQTLDMGVCEVIRWRDGQILEEWSYLDDQYAWDAFWS